MHATQPRHGVRYEFVLADATDDAATYAVTVFIAEARSEGRVAVSAAGVQLLDEVPGLDPAHRTQLLALAKTISKRAADEPWPRRVNRWRSPGVR
jgi:hypothetical protein